MEKLTIFMTRKIWTNLISFYAIIMHVAASQQELLKLAATADHRNVNSQILTMQPELKKWRTGHHLEWENKPFFLN